MRPQPIASTRIGGMTLAGGIAAALFHRERTGEAQVVDVSLLGTAMWVMSPDVVASKLIGQPQLPLSSRASRPNPAVNNYRTKEGRWLMLVHLQSDRYWPDLCQRLGRPDPATDPRFANIGARANNADGGSVGRDANASRVARRSPGRRSGYLQEVDGKATAGKYREYLRFGLGSKVS
ncbi:CoA transferase [Candidatus Binatus sp.]|uniref:CoA transferase n=1 Tax=Candidatus Binatus sp. TaxID=2811406 RepID=UPI00351D3B7A